MSGRQVFTGGGGYGSIAIIPLNRLIGLGRVVLQVKSRLKKMCR